MLATNPTFLSIFRTPDEVCKQCICPASNLELHVCDQFEFCHPKINSYHFIKYYEVNTPIFYRLYNLMILFYFLLSKMTKLLPRYNQPS